MTYFQRLIVNTLTFISLSVILPNDRFYVSSLMVAILASFVLSILNTLVKPLLHILSLPITILTFGLFSLVINGMMLSMTSYILGEQNFGFSSLGTAILVAVIMSLVNSVVINKNVGNRY